MSADKQSRFSRQKDHIFLKTEKKQKESKPAVGKKKKGKFFPKKTTENLAVLSQRTMNLYITAKNRTHILRSPRIHFILELSDTINWKTIANSINNLKVKIVDYIDDKTLRVSLEKELYEDFLLKLKKNFKYIQNIREIGVFEKIDETLYEEIRKQPEKKNLVSLEFSNINGVEDSEFIEESLSKWIETKNYGVLKRSYQSETILLLSGFLPNEGIKTIVEEVDALSYVARIPKTKLSGSHNNSSISLSSVIPLESVSKNQKNEKLQSIVIIDSGINNNHPFLQKFITDTYDYSTNTPIPCIDNVNHGSSVAGLAIYGNDLRNTPKPSANVIMVKNFEKVGNKIIEINRDILDVIRETIDRYRFDSRILNCSFNMGAPNPSLTKALDEIIFRSEYVVVVSAGNVDGKNIESFLDSGLQYPTYLDNSPIYFPGDCKNVITVGSHTKHSSNFVPSNCPSPFTRVGFYESVIKPDVMAHGGNYERNVVNGQSVVFAKQGLGVFSAANNSNSHTEQFGTSFSSPTVANVAASILQKRLDFSPFLIKALVISSCESMVNQNNSSTFEENIQGFGKVNKIYAVNSQDYRVCYLMQGEFDKANKDEYHRYRFLFPDKADEIEVTMVCGKLHTGHKQESKDWVHLFFKRPGVKFKSRLKKGFQTGNRYCNCTYKEKVRIYRGSRGSWIVNVFPHFSKTPMPQKLKYGLVITVSSSKLIDIYAPIRNWVEPQKQRIIVPSVIATSPVT